MPEYKVIFAHSATRELKRLDPPIAKRILSAIEKLKQDPRPPGCVKLTGSDNDWRVRVGDWRIVYTIDDTRQLVDIGAVRHRSDIYR